jgi:hypothetical protein
LPEINEKPTLWAFPVFGENASVWPNCDIFNEKKAQYHEKPDVFCGCPLRAIAGHPCAGAAKTANPGKPGSGFHRQGTPAFFPFGVGR